MVACSCETSNNVLFSTTPHKGSWEWRLRARTASSKDCARCDPERTGRGGQVGEKVFSLPASEMYPIQKGDRQGEFEVMGPVQGRGWGGKKAEGRAGKAEKEPPKEFGVFEEEGNQQPSQLDLLGWVLPDKSSPFPLSCAARFGK